MKCFKCNEEISQTGHRGLLAHQRGAKCKTTSAARNLTRKRKADAGLELVNKKAKAEEDQMEDDVSI